MLGDLPLGVEKPQSIPVSFGTQSMEIAAFLQVWSAHFAPPARSSSRRKMENLDPPCAPKHTHTSYLSLNVHSARAEPASHPPGSCGL